MSMGRGLLQRSCKYMAISYFDTAELFTGFIGKNFIIIDIFKDCHFLNSSYTFLSNLNAPNGYGTASLVRNNYVVNGY